MAGETNIKTIIDMTSDNMLPSTSSNTTLIHWDFYQQFPSSLWSHLSPENVYYRSITIQFVQFVQYKIYLSLIATIFYYMVCTNKET